MADKGKLSAHPLSYLLVFLLAYFIWLLLMAFSLGLL